jgi:hypothetical protein
VAGVQEVQDRIFDITVKEIEDSTGANRNTANIKQAVDDSRHTRSNATARTGPLFVAMSFEAFAFPCALDVIRYILRT